MGTIETNVIPESAPVVDNSHREYVYIDRNEILHKKRWYWFIRRTQDIVFSILSIAFLCRLCSLSPC